MAGNEENPEASLRATSDEVKRLLEIGKLLVAVLTPEEINQIDNALNVIISTDRIRYASRESNQRNR
jgi:hypothetical protein